MVATALLLSACQPDRVISGWSAQSTGRASFTPHPELAAPAHFVSGWVPHWSGDSGMAAIKNSSAAVGDVSPFWYGTANNGTITRLGTNTNLQKVIAATRAAGLPLIPTIADSTGAGVMSGILGDPAARAAHVKNIVDLVVNNNYDGIDIDYEVFAFNHPGESWDSIKPKWIAFVSELSTALHANSKLLSITVPPVWNGGNSGYTVYAQQEIAPMVDRLRLMVYDFNVSSPGPIAPMNWVTDVLQYSKSVGLPVGKLQLGVPAYGRHWATQKVATETCPDGAIRRETVLMKNIATATAGHDGVRDGSGELKYTWTESVTGPRTKPLPPPVVPPASVVIAEINAAANGSPLQPALRLSPSAMVTCTVQHTVYVPDSTSVDQRSDAAQAAGWRGIIVWAFGYEDIYMFPVLAA